MTPARDPGLRHFLLTAAEYLVDSRVGIIRAVHELPRAAGSPGFFHFTARSASSAFQRAVHSGGASIDREAALAKAIGEVVERYCAGLVDPARLPLARYREADFACVPPRDFALYTPAQTAQPGFPFAPFDDATPVHWAPAVELTTGITTGITTGAACHVPAVKVYLAAPRGRATGERAIAQSITTGLASHATPEDAAINGICEVIERDAFTITWQARMAMPHLRIPSLGERNRDLVARLSRPGLEVRLLNITLDHGVPTILAALRSSSRELPALVLAAATDLDPDIAVQKSLEELELTRSFACWLQRTRPRPAPADGDHVATREDHVAFHADHGNAGRADFVFASGTAQDLSELPNLATHDAARDLRVLVDRISALGERVLIADLTSPDVRALGLTVVRAVIPGFHPLVFGHRLRALGGARLWRVPQALGHPGITPAGGDNLVPHPFP